MIIAVIILKKYLFSGQKGDLYEYNTLYTERS